MSCRSALGGDSSLSLIILIVWYVYILQSLKNNKLYTGSTSNLKHRFAEHNSLIGGTYTIRNAPFKLMYFECFIDKKDALIEEKFLKSGKGRESLKYRLKYTLQPCPVV